MLTAGHRSAAALSAQIRPRRSRAGAAVCALVVLAASATTARAQKRISFQGGHEASLKPAKPLTEHVSRAHREFRDAVGNSVGSIANPNGRIRTVLYPMGNADVSSAFAAFDGPSGTLERLIIVDALPFGTPQEIRSRHSDARLQAQYFGSVRAVESESYVSTIKFQRGIEATGPALLWELQAMGARAISVQYRTASGHKRAPPSRARLRGLTRENRAEGGLKMQPPPLVNYDPKHRDIVEVSFDLGDRRASVLYVQHDLGDLEGTPPVLRNVITGGYDGYFEKAPLGPIERFRDLALNGLNDGGVAVGEYLGEAAPGLPLADAREIDFRMGHGGRRVWLATADSGRQKRGRFAALWKAKAGSQRGLKAGPTRARLRRVDAKKQPESKRRISSPRRVPGSGKASQRRPRAVR